MKYALLILLLGTPFALNACSGVRDSMGLNKSSPDEFAVIRHEPLAMPPPNYTQLQVPRAGAPRPQEKEAVEQARQAVLGVNKMHSSSISGGESAFLTEAGANNIDPNIRAQVEKDALKNAKQQQPIGTRLFGIGGNSEDNADIVDADAEALRLKDNREKGLSATTGETATLAE